MPAILQKAFYVLLLGFAATIPFNAQFSFSNVKLNNIFLVLLLAVSIPLGVYNRKRPKTYGKTMLLSFVFLYLLFMLALLHTENLDQGFSDLLETKISILLFPIIFYFVPDLNSKKLKTVLVSFAASCVLTSLYCVSIGIYRYFRDNDPSFLSYHNLSLLAGMQAVYLAMCLCFSIGILLYYSFTANHEPHKRWRCTTYLLAAMFLVVCVFLLAARTHIFILILGTAIASVFYFYRRNNLVMSLLKSSAVAAIAFCAMLLVPETWERSKQLINYNNEYGITKKWGEQQMRPLMWDCAFQLIRKAPVTGPGLVTYWTN